MDIIAAFQNFFTGLVDTFVQLFEALFGGLLPPAA